MLTAEDRIEKLAKRYADLCPTCGVPPGDACRVRAEWLETCPRIQIDDTRNRYGRMTDTAWRTLSAISNERSAIDEIAKALDIRPAEVVEALIRLSRHYYARLHGDSWSITSNGAKALLKRRTDPCVEDARIITARMAAQAGHVVARDLVATFGIKGDTAGARLRKMQADGHLRRAGQINDGADGRPLVAFQLTAAGKQLALRRLSFEI